MIHVMSCHVLEGVTPVLEPSSFTPVLEPYGVTPVLEPCDVTPVSEPSSDSSVCLKPRHCFSKVVAVNSHEVMHEQI